ncbi:hypothetical protein [Thermodesulfovibrio sp.]|uniref:hypothetical protein n=1 Tax=Thermodesulfovibrio sp. TaxID=2067987 RepID=UPI00309F380D
MIDAHIRYKIKKAEENFYIIRNLNVLDEIQFLAEELLKIIRKADEERFNSGMVEICQDCGKNGIPCCGSGIEEKYSLELLMINLILSAELPTEREIKSGCFFLKSNGCCLIARDVFCINYICNKIQTKLSPRSLIKLRELEGNQLTLQFKIEEHLKKIINHSLK